MAIDKGKALCKKLGLDPKKVLPYEKKVKCGNGLMIYDPEEVFRDIVAASKGSDADLSGILAVEQQDGISPYDQLRELRGVQWPAPTYQIARLGGTPRRYLGQEDKQRGITWPGKPYGAFSRPGGKALMKLCEQDYSKIQEVCGKLMQYGHRDRPGQGPWLIDELAQAVKEERDNLLEVARNLGLTPDLPDLDVYEDASMSLADHKAQDVYPFWLGLGIVYEHFHSAKTIRGATTQKLVPEQYVEMNLHDAQRLGLRDGDPVRLVTRRGSFECRVTVGLQSELRPSRSEVPEGYLFSPWNLSVADSADPTKNRWLVNAVSHRAWDPVSGQADFKKLAARIERI
jgi:nitrate reductase NapA